MHKTFKVISVFLVPLFLIACSAAATRQQPTPPASGGEAEGNGLYTDMLTYGEYVGCISARRTAGVPETEVEPVSEDLPGTQEDYQEGWREGFNKCRLGLGPVVIPGGAHQ